MPRETAANAEGENTCWGETVHREVARPTVRPRVWETNGAGRIAPATPCVCHDKDDILHQIARRYVWALLRGRSDEHALGPERVGPWQGAGKQGRH